MQNSKELLLLTTVVSFGEAMVWPLLLFEAATEAAASEAAEAIVSLWLRIISLVEVPLATVAVVLVVLV